MPCGNALSCREKAAGSESNVNWLPRAVWVLLRLVLRESPVRSVLTRNLEFPRLGVWVPRWAVSASCPIGSVCNGRTCIKLPGPQDFRTSRIPSTVHCLLQDRS